MINVHGFGTIEKKLCNVQLFSNNFIGKKRVKIIENISKLKNNPSDDLQNWENVQSYL